MMCGSDSWTTIIGSSASSPQIINCLRRAHHLVTPRVRGSLAHFRRAAAHRLYVRLGLRERNDKRGEEADDRYQRREGRTLKIERLQPEGMNVRMSGGQPSYSHVVTVSGTGKIFYTAGQLARDIDGNCVGKGDMRAQMEQTFKN